MGFGGNVPDEHYPRHRALTDATGMATVAALLPMLGMVWYLVAWAAGWVIAGFQKDGA
jgi:hypothetical protein